MAPVAGQHRGTYRPTGVGGACGHCRRGCTGLGPVGTWTHTPLQWLLIRGVEGPRAQVQVQTGAELRALRGGQSGASSLGGWQCVEALASGDPAALAVGSPGGLDPCQGRPRESFVAARAPWVLDGKVIVSPSPTVGGTHPQGDSSQHHTHLGDEVRKAECF